MKIQNTKLPGGIFPEIDETLQSSYEQWFFYASYRFFSIFFQNLIVRLLKKKKMCLIARASEYFIPSPWKIPAWGLQIVGSQLILIFSAYQEKKERRYWEMQNRKKRLEKEKQKWKKKESSGVFRRLDRDKIALELMKLSKHFHSNSIRISSVWTISLKIILGLIVTWFAFYSTLPHQEGFFFLRNEQTKVPRGII